MKFDRVQIPSGVSVAVEDAETLVDGTLLEIDHTEDETMVFYLVRNTSANDAVVAVKGRVNSRNPETGALVVPAPSAEVPVFDGASYQTSLSLPAGSELQLAVVAAGWDAVQLAAANDTLGSPAALQVSGKRFRAPQSSATGALASSPLPARPVVGLTVTLGAGVDGGATWNFPLTIEATDENGAAFADGYVNALVYPRINSDLVPTADATFVDTEGTSTGSFSTALVNIQLDASTGRYDGSLQVAKGTYDGTSIGVFAILNYVANGAFVPSGFIDSVNVKNSFQTVPS